MGLGIRRLLGRLLFCYVSGRAERVRGDGVERAHLNDSSFPEG
jgi:hypothetical protein